MQREFVIAVGGRDGKEMRMEVRQKTAKVTKRKVKTWTSEEDSQLLELYQRLPKRWADIAGLMIDRNENQCLHRFRRLSMAGRSHKIWSAEEDETIRKLIRKYGKNWKLLSELLGSKNGKQIRERFINKLDPTIRKEDWSEIQDRRILELYSRLGSKWSEISKHLPGRPENKIKNRFYSFIQKNYDIRFREVEATPLPVPLIEVEGACETEGRSPTVMGDSALFSEYDMPSINQIEFENRGELISNGMLESVLRVEECKWQGNYQSIVELNSNNDLFFRFQN